MKSKNTTPSQPLNGLRPTVKPFVIEMSGPFMRAGVKINLARLTAMMKRIFLRLGFDGYRGESTNAGFRIRIYGCNVQTGRYCDTHSVNIGKLSFPGDFIVCIQDMGSYYTLSLKLATEAGTREAA